MGKKTASASSSVSFLPLESKGKRRGKKNWEVFGTFEPENEKEREAVYRRVVLLLGELKIEGSIEGGGGGWLGQ